MENASRKYRRAKNVERNVDMNFRDVQLFSKIMLTIFGIKSDKILHL